MAIEEKKQNRLEVPCVYCCVVSKPLSVINVAKKIVR